MFYNFLKTAWRNIAKRKTISILNILGLSIGISACILVMQYVEYERSYDAFHPDLNRLYRLNLGMTNSDNNILEFRATNHPAAGKFLKEDYPSVQSFARLVDAALFSGSTVLSRESSGSIESHYEENMYLADSSFLSMFGFEMIAGDRKTALRNPEHIVVTESLAQRYFGQEDPMGQVLKLNDAAELIVNGVMEDPPPNSHFRISALLSASGFSDGLNNAWIWPEFYTYIKLEPNVDFSSLEKELDPFVDRYLGDIMEEFGIEEKMSLQPVKDIHLDGNLLKEVSSNEDRSKVTFMIIIALMILLVAWINYVNLSTSRSIERATEIGVRKVIGASRNSIITQFLIESALINFLAILLSFGLVGIFSPYFDYLAGTNIQSTGSIADYLSDGRKISLLLGIFVAGVVFSGIYPAVVSSAFSPLSTIKGSTHGLTRRINFRQVLVVFQFAIGILMLAGTMIVFKQVSFMRKHDLGFNKDQLLVVRAPFVNDSLLENNVELLRREVLQYPEVKHFTASSDILGHLIQNNNSVHRRDQTHEQSFFATFLAVDHSYLSTYQMELLAGRNFEEGRPLDRDNLILNDRAAKSLGFNSPEEIIGEIVTYKDDGTWRDGEVLGVVRGFNHRSLAHEQEPFILFNRPLIPYNYYSLKVDTRDISQTVDRVKEAYADVFPKNPFDHFFLDDYFDQQYRADQRFGWIFGFFACLAIFVACLGLIGLVAHITIRKAKVAGIHKILGASAMQILFLFGKQFLWLILIAAVVAVPVAWWSGRVWIADYAYQSNLSIWLFLLPVVLVLMISGLAIVWQSSRVAWIQPAEVLKD